MNIELYVFLKDGLKLLKPSEFEKKMNEYIWHLTEAQFQVRMKRMTTALKLRRKDEYRSYGYCYKMA